MNITRYISLVPIVMLTCATAFAQQGRGHSQDLETVQQTLRSLPELNRSSFICEIEELVFMEDGSLPYENGGAENFNGEENRYFKMIRREAIFIALDGRIYNWWDVQWQLIGNSDLRAKWVDAKRGLGACGQNAVLRPFLNEAQQLKKYYANRSRILAEIKRGTYNPEKHKIDNPKSIPPEPSPAGSSETAALSSALGMLKKLDNQDVRDIVISAIMNGADAETLCDQTYISRKGEAAYVFEDLEKANAIGEATKVLQTLPATESACSVVKRRYGKVIAALRRGRDLSSLRLDSFSKNLSARLAANEVNGARSDSPEYRKKVAEEALSVLRAIEDPVCRTCVAVSIAESYTPQELFESAVVDTHLHAMNCFDVVHRCQMEEPLLKLMADAAVYDEIRKSVESAYKKEIEDQSKVRERREAQIKAVLSKVKAQEAMEKLQKMEAASADQ